MATIIFNASDIETCQPQIIVRENISKRVGTIRRQLSVRNIYRRQLRTYRSMARTIDAHPALANTLLWTIAITGTIAVLLCHA